MLRHIKQFFSVQFKITECDDEVYSSDSEDEEKDNKENEQDSDAQDSDMNDESSESDKEKKKKLEELPQFPKTFIFSCIGVGLTNISRKAE